MQKLHIMMAVTALLVLASCSKHLQVDPVSFEVTPSSTTYDTGDTVSFKFEGQPDMITFYSGEPGHNYENRNRTLAKGIPQMQFTYLGHYGPQNNTLHLLISTDFDGTYDPADIAKATWTDISDKVNFVIGVTLPSGVIDLSPYVKVGEVFYFAFKYLGSQESTQKSWVITDFKIDLQQEDGLKTPVADMMTADWTAVNIKNADRVWNVTASQLYIVGGAAGTPDNEDWLITGPLNPNKVLPDRGVAIKDISNNLFQYSHIYNEIGSYKAVFIGTNASPDEERSAVKVVDITIK